MPTHEKAAFPPAISKASLNIPGLERGHSITTPQDGLEPVCLYIAADMTFTLVRPVKISSRLAHDAFNSYYQPFLVVAPSAEVCGIFPFPLFRFEVRTFKC